VTFLKQADSFKFEPFRVRNFIVIADRRRIVPKLLWILVCERISPKSAYV